MRTAGVVQRFLLILMCAGMLGACASSYPTRTVSYKETPLDKPAASPSDSELLSVRIEAFDPGKLPEDAEVAKGLSTEIRNAESYYIPVQLKETMQKSGHWGPVRVTPRGARDGEVVVSGKILESDAEILKLEIQVRDAAGVRWFTKEYESVVDDMAYVRAAANGVDAFQGLYTEIANDIAAYRKKMTKEDHAAIRQVAELKFGTEFAPDAYDGYLKKADIPEEQGGGLQKVLSFFNTGERELDRKPIYTVSRLPSSQDPVVQRVERLRAREELLVDTLDQQYDTLARGVQGPYTNWRTSRLKEVNALREAESVKRSEQAKAVAVGILGVIAGAALASQNSGGGCYGCVTAGAAVAGGAVAIAVQMADRASNQAAAETSMRRAALEELGNSLASDVKPTVMEVEGQTVELKGTIEEQFKSWREVLKQLRENETAPLQRPLGQPLPTRSAGT